MHAPVQRTPHEWSPRHVGGDLGSPVRRTRREARVEDVQWIFETAVECELLSRMTLTAANGDHHFASHVLHCCLGGQENHVRGRR